MMKRRDFLNLTVGATVISPLFNTATGQYTPLIDPPPGLEPTPVSEAGMWFMKEPTRIGWFLLRYSDAQQSAAEFVQRAANAGMNLLCITAGGSFAFYPSKIPYHEYAPGITGQNDFFGDIVAEAKKNKIRIGARFDFSKQHADTVKAHPEWFFTNADGTHPVDASGRTPPCINGDFFRDQAVRIMQEVISRYQPAMVYLNNFGNNLGGQDLPDPCQCANCKKYFKTLTGKSLPLTMNQEVRTFLKHSTHRTGRLFFDAVMKQAPATIFINADTTPTHGWHSETRMVLSPSKLWIYITSEAVNRQRTSYPASVTCNNVTSYSSNASRLVLMPPAETKVRLYQAMAHGSPPTYVVTGTLLHDDMQSIDAARDVFNWHARHEDVFGDTYNPARVMMLVPPETSPRGRNLVTQQSFRGIYRILTENHIPVVVSENPETIQEGPARFDLVIVTPGAPVTGLENFVKQGGKVIFAGIEPGFATPAKIKEHRLTRVAYLEIKDESQFPSLAGTKYLMASSVCPYKVIDIFSSADVDSMSFIEYPPEPAPLTFVPPMIENPGEVSQSDLKHTNIPALLWRNHGRGSYAYLPWDIGMLFDRLALPAHAGLLMDIVDKLLPGERQLQTDAHSSVEMVLAAKKTGSRHFLHLVNLSGQTQNNYMAPVPMPPMRVAIRGRYQKVISRQTAAVLPHTKEKDYTVFSVPSLNEYDVIEMIS